MKYTKGLAFIWIILMLFSIYAQESVKITFALTDGKKIIAPGGRPIHLRGINLGNWLLPEGYMFKLRTATAERQIREIFKELIGPAEANRFWRTYYDTYITEADILQIKKLGLNSIRVPFNAKLFMLEDYPHIRVDLGFEMLERVVRWSKAAGIYVILDMHGAPCGQTGTNIDDSAGHPWLFESKECQEQTILLWREIASRFRDESIILGYDLLNEPIPHYEGYEIYNPRLEPLYKRMVAAIREVDDCHIVFLGGAQWNSNFSVFGAPFDPNAVYTFHKYWTNVEQAEIQSYCDYRDQYNVPLWMGESGENRDEWIRDFRRLLDKNEIGWCFWPYKKMDSKSCITSFERPPYWDEIQAFVKNRYVELSEIRNVRPPIEHCQTSMAGLLENIRFEKCKLNTGYIEALGLTIEK